MNLEVNKNNLYLFLPGKISSVSIIYAEKNNCNVFDAMKLFYNSILYQQLQNEETKLWHLGAIALYELWQDEINSKGVL